MEKTFVYFANVSNLDLVSVYQKLPKFRQEKLDKLELERDKKLSAGVYLLLQKALEKQGMQIDDFKFSTTKNGKPMLVGCPKSFNYSHSGDYVMVAISDSEVGVDIQKITDINPKIEKVICNEKDIKFIKENVNKIDALNKVFVLKEAYYKCYGTNNYKNIEINYKQSTVYKIKDYYYAVVPGNEIELDEVIL